MRILILGHRGYIGSHLYKHLNQASKERSSEPSKDGSRKRYQVFGFDLLDQQDLRNPDQVMSAFQLIQPTCVIHLAAFISVPGSEKDPITYYQNNVATLPTILTAMQAVNCRNIIFASTAAVYQTSNETLTEESTLNPVSIYGKTKLMAEQILLDCCSRTSINAIIFRFFNVAGMDPELSFVLNHMHLIPSLVIQQLKQAPIRIYGSDYETADGTCVRDYISIFDLCQAIELGIQKLVKSQQYFEIFNLGTHTGQSVRQIIDEFCEVIAQKLPIEIHDRRPGDATTTVANATKAHQILNWQPQHTIRHMIEGTLASAVCAQYV